MLPFIITQQVNPVFILWDKQGIQTQYRNLIALDSNITLYMEWQYNSGQ